MCGVSGRFHIGLCIDVLPVVCSVQVSPSTPEAQLAPRNEGTGFGSDGRLESPLRPEASGHTEDPAQARATS